MRSIFDRFYSKKNAQSYNGKKKRLSLQHDRKSLEKQSKKETERKSFKDEVKINFYFIELKQWIHDLT
jgi:hypothetical protein